MKFFRRPLLPVLLVVFLLACGIAIARTRTAKSSLAPAVAAAAVADCADDCKTRFDAALERCNQMPEASRENCQRVANIQHGKCVDRCEGRGTP
jgi:hypothetical protein